MRATLTMTINDLRIFFSQPGNWVGLTLLPILFTVGLGFAFGGDSGPELLRVEVIDQDRSAASGHLLDEMAAANDTLKLCLLTNNLTEIEAGITTAAPRCEQEETTLQAAQERVRAGASDALIAIPAGYAAAVAPGLPQSNTPQSNTPQSNTPQSNTTVEISFYSLTPATSPDAVWQTLDSLLQRLNSAGLTATVADAVLRRFGEQTELSPVIEPWRAAFVADVFEQSATLWAERPAAVRFTSVGGAAGETVNEANASV